MKKLIFFLSILLLTACDQDSKTDDKITESTIKTAEMTLNGIEFSDAEKMVKEFQKDSLSTDSMTSIWFPEAFVKSVINILTYEDGDGARFYFARKANRNTVVVVSTRAAGKDPQHPGTIIHQDYFDHNTSLLNSADVKNEDELPLTRGADLFTSNPCTVIENCPYDRSSVTCKEAHEWVAKFRSTQYKDHEKLNSKSVWYSLELFEKLRNELLIARARGVESDGIRLYFVKNDKDRHGFVIITTFEDTNNIHRDYYECYDSRKFRGGNDRGEECPVNCTGTTWP